MFVKNALSSLKPLNTGNLSVLTNPLLCAMFPISTRMRSGRENCDPDAIKPKCEANPPEEACKSYLKYKNEFPFFEMIYKQECCGTDCPDMYPRFDDLYYQESDKSKRVYVRTWPECVDPVRKVPVCKRTKLRPVIIRSQRDKCAAVTACARSPCAAKGKSKCPEFNLQGCKPARRPAHCKIYRGPSNCKKRCVQYPSFSECSRHIKPLDLNECHCLQHVFMCEINEALRRLRANRKIPKKEDKCAAKKCKSNKANPDVKPLETC